jgi:hypothetical protein
MSTVITRSLPPQRLVDAANPMVRALIRSRWHGVADGTLLMLHVTGRRTGRRYDIPAGYVPLGDRMVVVTEHTWRANLRDVAELDVTHHGRHERMHAALDENPVTVATTLRELIDGIGLRATRQRLGLRMTTSRMPTAGELEAAARDFDLATITLTPARG